ncbi:VUT family protein [Salmonella enterica subsp. enterica]|nr:VUT family protein [Salmonella enterica subsp. enterica]
MPSPHPTKRSQYDSVYTITARKSVVLAIAIPFTAIISSNYLRSSPSLFWFPRPGARLVFLYFSRHRSYRAYFGALLARRIIFAVGRSLRCWCVIWCHRCSIWAPRQGFAALANLICSSPAFRRAASFTAYALGQILDNHVLTACQNRRWWLAPTAASTLFGNISDTLCLFLFIVLK